MIIHKITSYADCTDLVLLAIVQDRFFANELVTELAQRFNAKITLIKPDNIMSINSDLIHQYLGSNPSIAHLREIRDHGIHNITNDFSNEGFNYDAISDEFKIVVTQLLRAMGED